MRLITQGQNPTTEGVQEPLEYANMNLANHLYSNIVDVLLRKQFAKLLRCSIRENTTPTEKG